MLHSIQEYLKIINSRLTKLNCMSLLVTTICLALFTLYLYLDKNAENTAVSYVQNESKFNTNTSDSRPFASISGQTYTFSWCKGANNIILKNRLYFANEQEAKNSGRFLSKLCQK